VNTKNPFRARLEDVKGKWTKSKGVLLCVGFLGWFGGVWGGWGSFLASVGTQRGGKQIPLVKANFGKRPVKKKKLEEEKKKYKPRHAPYQTSEKNGGIGRIRSRKQFHQSQKPKTTQSGAIGVRTRRGKQGGGEKRGLEKLCSREEPGRAGREKVEREGGGDRRGNTQDQPDRYYLQTILRMK